ncbi:enoyl-CoA hydratase/isomerase family protein [Rhizobium mongolense]|uniref:enoyl-CoA hydratase/isomerase family protein n=1 Tax=Rhizobium mongolense TaxID=57676 RepID=UPI0035586F5E
MPITEDEHILVERRGSAGIIRLNRPRALNSLTMGMIRAISSVLDRYERDPSIATVLIVGEGERAFCSGGDIRALYGSGRSDTSYAQVFWQEEFDLTYRIARYPKPYVAFMDGITMGGGVGISTHGKHRIVTERTRLAMPETGIGYFPDVGASWFLPRMPGEAGTWIGLTGLEITGADAVYTGLADVQIESARLPELIDRLAELPLSTSSGSCDLLFRQFSLSALPGPVERHRELIDRAFSFDTVEEILLELETEGSDFAAETVRILSSRSPKSLKVTLRLLREGAKSGSLLECLKRELVACGQVLKEPDFYEGVRAAVVDKDRNPKWTPNHIRDVTEEMIVPFFHP